MDRFLKFTALMAGYPLAYQLAYVTASLAWYPPAGMRFAIFMLVRPAWWLPLLLGNELVDASLHPERWGLAFRDPLHFAALLLGSASGPLLLRKRRFAGIEGLASVAWLLGAMLLSSAAASMVNVAWPYRDVTGSINRGGLSPELLFLQMTLGDYLGMLVLVPLALMCFRQRPTRAHWDAWKIDVPAVLLPVLLAAAWLLRGAHDYQTYLFIAALCLAPVMYMAFRSSWRGSTIGLTATTVIVGVSGWANGHIKATTEGQLFIAVTGTTVLVLGVAMEALRASQQALRRQNAMLAARNARLDELTIQLRDTARRNLSLSEDLRRSITGEVHDEIGQNITALQVHLKIADTQGVPGRWLEPMREIVTTMRRSVTGLLTGLRPPGLDEFGLHWALAEGSIREVVRAAGLDYQLRARGDLAQLSRLDANTQTALYRVVQEAATNTVRHAKARRFRVLLRVRQQGPALHLRLRCIDDGSGLPAVPRQGGIGLQCMEDRVRSLGGRVRIHGDGRGTRVIVSFVFPLGGPDQEFFL